MWMLFSPWISVCASLLCGMCLGWCQGACLYGLNQSCFRLDLLVLNYNLEKCNKKRWRVNQWYNSLGIFPSNAVKAFLKGVDMYGISSFVLGFHRSQTRLKVLSRIAKCFEKKVSHNHRKIQKVIKTILFQTFMWKFRPHSLDSLLLAVKLEVR